MVFTQLALLLVVASLPGTAGLTAPQKVYGVVGGSVTLKCQYGNAYAFSGKYWCRGDRSILCGVVASSGHMSERACVEDDPAAGEFTVTMDALKVEDTGTYWCGIYRIGNDMMSKVELRVIDGPHLLTGPQVVLGFQGKSVTVDCEYDMHYRSHGKYWCRGLEQESCVVMARIEGLQEEHIGSKLLLEDNQTSGVFSVTMNELLMEDAGRYWCGITITKFDIVVPVELNITDLNTPDKPRNPLGGKSNGMSTALLIPLIGGSILLVLVITIFFIRYEKHSAVCGKRKAEEEEFDPVFKAFSFREDGQDNQCSAMANNLSSQADQDFLIYTKMKGVHGHNNVIQVHNSGAVPPSVEFSSQQFQP